MQLATPKNQTAEILYCLLNYDYISFRSIFEETGILNLSARISNLRLDYNLDIPCTEVEVKNKFGRKIKYGTWKLTDKQQGRVIYSIINK